MDALVGVLREDERRGWLARGLRELLDDVEQFGAVIAAFTAELHEFDRLGQQRAALGCPAWRQS